MPFVICSSIHLLNSLGPLRRLEYITVTLEHPGEFVWHIMEELEESKGSLLIQTEIKIRATKVHSNPVAFEPRTRI